MQPGVSRSWAAKARKNRTPRPRSAQLCRDERTCSLEHFCRGVRVIGADLDAEARVAAHDGRPSTLHGERAERHLWHVETHRAVAGKVGHGEIANEEIGADFAAAPSAWLDVAARSAYSLQTVGFADALASAAVRTGAFRVETFATQRSPSRLLPATSLFSVLGDFPSRTLGSTVRWQAAPRLDVLASAALQSVAGELGGNGWIRGLLRLDDPGDGSVGVELRRQSVATARWTGVRTVLTQPLGEGLRYSNELEIGIPDEPKDGVVAWPWALVALSWRSPAAWEIAGAIEASATPQHRYQTTALARVSHTWAVKP